MSDNTLPLESEIEEEARSNSYLLKNFRVAKCEYKKFFVLSIMFGIIGFIYSFMRILKDTFVMVRQEPTCILYIKMFYIMPLSFVVIIVINLMLSSRTVSKIFTITSLFFMALFFLLGFLIMLEDTIMFNPARIGNMMDTGIVDARGLGYFKYFIQTINQPIATLVYIVAELWGSLILSYLFLSYLNETCPEKQNARFIPPLFIVANLSLLFSAIVTTFFFKIREKLNYEENQVFQGMIFFLEGALVLMLLGSKHYLEQYILTKPLYVVESQRVKKAKVNTSFMEGVETMAKSKFLLAMCGIVCFFSAVFNMLESVYKNGIKRAAESMNLEKGKYSGKFNIIDQLMTSIIVIVLNLSPFSDLVDRKGWIYAAMISPVVALISTVMICGSAIYNSAADDISFSLFNKIWEGYPRMYFFENLVGTLCLSAMKIFKFAAFDVSKERISMRIEGKYRPKFKSVYDGIFNKFGKSAGAFYGISMGFVFSSFDIRSVSPVTIIFSLAFCYLWIVATLYLTKKYDTSLNNSENIDLDLEREAQKKVVK